MWHFSQTAECAFTNCFWFVNFPAFLCGFLRLPWCATIHKCIFFNRELSVANPVSSLLSASPQERTPRAPLSARLLTSADWLTVEDVSCICWTIMWLAVWSIVQTDHPKETSPQLSHCFTHYWKLMTLCEGWNVSFHHETISVHKTPPVMWLVMVILPHTLLSVSVRWRSAAAYRLWPAVSSVLQTIQRFL